MQGRGYRADQEVDSYGMKGGQDVARAVTETTAFAVLDPPSNPVSNPRYVVA